jgi:tetratricopeptide (TPR) repeat protein
MGSLGIFRRKKEVEGKEEKKTPESTEKSLLEELCKSDTELLSALSHTLLLDPSRLTEEGIDSFIEKAQGLEKNKDFLRARINYQAAGEIALYEGKLEQAKKFFKKCEELESNPEYKKIFAYFSKKANAEKALKIAKEYYARTLEPREKTEA